MDGHHFNTIRGLEIGKDKPMKPERKPLPPAGYQMEQHGQSLTITFVERWSWTQLLLGFLVGGMIIVFGAVGLLRDLAADSAMPVVPLVGYALLFLFGMVLTYFGLANLMNRTKVVVTPSTLDIRHGPLPVFGNKTLDSTQIVALVVITVKDREGDTSYKLQARLMDGSTVKLLPGLGSDLSDPGAQFLAQEIEEQLGIREQTTEGED
jgi:hypothetical protein